MNDGVEKLGAKLRVRVACSKDEDPHSVAAEFVSHINDAEQFADALHCVFVAMTFELNDDDSVAREIFLRLVNGRVDPKHSGYLEDPEFFKSFAGMLRDQLAGYASYVPIIQVPVLYKQWHVDAVNHIAGLPACPSEVREELEGFFRPSGKFASVLAATGPEAKPR